LELDPAGVLAPTLVATETDGRVSSLAGESDRLYWGVAGDPFGTNRTAVRSVSVDGGTIDTLYTSTATRNVASIAVTGPDVVFVSSSYVYRASIGVAAEPLATIDRTVSGGSVEDVGIAAMDGFVWYSSVGAHQLVRERLDGSELIRTSIHHDPYAIAVDATHVYWTDLPPRVAGGSFASYRVLRADR
jgi:hypothetical protein